MGRLYSFNVILQSITDEGQYIETSVWLHSVNSVKFWNGVTNLAI